MGPTERGGTARIAVSALLAMVAVALAGCATPVRGTPIAAPPSVAPPSVAPTTTATPTPDRPALDAVLLPVGTVSDVSLADPGSEVSGSLLVNCTAGLRADGRLVLAVQRWWDDDQGAPQDFEVGDVTVGHVAATYRDMTGAQVVDEVRSVAGSQCRTYTSRSGSTWQLDRETPASWPGVTSYGYCIQVVAPANRAGYSCTSYAARGDIVSRLTVSVAGPDGARSKASTSTLFDDMAARAAARLPAA